MSTAADTELSQLICERLIAKGLLKSTILLKRHGQGGQLPDSKLVFLSPERQEIVVTVSPIEFPAVVREECDKSAVMRSVLGDLGAPILVPLDEGFVNSSSYAVLPYCKPLSNRPFLARLDRVRVKRRLLGWLLGVVKQQAMPCDASRYESSLDALCAIIATRSVTAVLLESARQRIASGHFVPRSTPMHGDMWKGNVLHGVFAAPFTLVDWRGSETEGYPVYDLVRTAHSFNMSRKGLKRELELHREALGCEREDLPIYLLGALGHFASRIGHMPPEKFRAMADLCVMLLSRALALAPGCSLV